MAALMAVGVVMLIPAVSCKKNTEKAAEENITAVLATIQFPDTLKDGSVLTYCTYEDKVLTYRMEIDKTTYTKMNTDKLKGKTLDNMVAGLFSKNLLEKVSQAKSSIRFIFVNGNDSVAQTYSPGELDSALVK